MLVRGIENDVLPTAQRHGIGVIPWSPLAGGLALRRLPQGRRRCRVDALGPPPARYDMSLPGNQRKFEAADALGALADEVGIPLIEIAIALVLNHPAVTARSSARARWSTSSPSCRRATARWTRELLDRIDEIVPPATNFNYADTGYDNPALGAGGAQKVMWRRAAIRAARRRVLRAWCRALHRSAGSLPAPRSARPTGEGSEGIGFS